MSADVIERASEPRNPPLAVRMGIIAFLSYNIAISAIFGTFSVMLASVVDRMGVSIEMAALAMPVAMIGNSIMSSAAGVMMARYPLRLMFLLGAVMCTIAFSLLAAFDNYIVYIAVYGLLLGPGITMIGTLGPATLVTRWFTRNRGLALGVVHLPIIYAAMPIASNWSYETYGANATYLAIAVTIGVLLIPAALLIREAPVLESGAQVAGGEGAGGSLTMRQLLASPRFWMLAFAATTVGSGATTIGASVIPMAATWGISRADAAILASTTAGVGIFGSVLFGWMADRLGGERGLTVITLGCALLCGAMLLRPPFPVLLVVIGLFGMCGAGMMPNLSRAIADNFGAASFSRGLGLFATLSLPVSLVLVPGFPAIHGLTGSYAPALAVLAGVYAAGFLCALTAAARRRKV